MKQKERKEFVASVDFQKESTYEDSVFDAFDKPQGQGPIPLQTQVGSTMAPDPEPVKDLLQEMKQPNKQFRRNITLSEEQFRKLELIKKMKNKERGKDDELVTIDKLMFDMIQQYLDSNPYPEVNTAFKKYMELKKMGYTDFI